MLVRYDSDQVKKWNNNYYTILAEYIKYQACTIQIFFILDFWAYNI